MLRPDTHARTYPHGYRPLPGSTLVVPEVLSRQRDVWPKDEGRLLDRVIALLESHSVKLLLKCGKADCTGQTLERIKTADGYTLQCGCTDRVFTRAF